MSKSESTLADVPDVGFRIPNAYNMAASEPSPVSDESSSESPHLHELVNETIARNQLTAMSPRSALLSHTSLRDHSAAEPVNTIIEPSRMRRRTSASERRRKRERDLANASPSQRELVRLLIDQEQEASILRQQLYTANQRVECEARRAAELERANQQVTQRCREINEDRVVVQQEASKAIQDSRLYHLELENAHSEIQRTRETLQHIEKERDEAEAAAARARTKTRKLRQQQMVAAAREEGRRLGFNTGFEHARQERLLITNRSPHNTTSRRKTRPSGRNLIANPYPPVGNPSSQQSTPSPNSQEENEEAVRRSRLFDDLNTSPQKPLSEISPSHLPLRNLPPIGPSVNSPAMSAKLPRTSPLRSFQPPPESTYESESHTPSRPPPFIAAQAPSIPTQAPSVPAQETLPQLGDRSPSIHLYTIEIPPPEQIARDELTREFNTKEKPNDIIKQMPRGTWVTADEHREIRGSPPAPYPGRHPPPLLPHLQPKNDRPAKPSLKVVRFPSLAKTKQQAASWYRSLSFRKKNKPVIDPVDEADQNQETTTFATSDKGIDKEPNTASTQASDPDAQYGVPPQPPQSWYKKSAPSSIHTTDVKRRPTSGIESSPGLSQFELLFTPHVGPNSVRSGKEGKRLKEKDGHLSVINEDRENTPTSDRILTDAMRANPSRITAPNLTNVQQRPSYEAIGSNSSPITVTKRRHHPLAIVVPDPDEPLPPPGVAYSQPGPINSHSLSHIKPMASQSSGTDASIGIEIVPPSGFAPDAVQSPPHTGRNHLSPYHVFRPTSRSSSRIIPLQSTISLRSLGGNHAEPPPSPTESRPRSRAGSRHTDSRGLDPIFPPSPRSTTSRRQSAMNATPHDNAMANNSGEDVRSVRSRTPRARTPVVMPPRETQTSTRPESIRSSASKKPSLNLSTNLVAGQHPQQLSSSALNLVSPLRHSTSRVSLRQAGSFSNGFDSSTYVDPAFFHDARPSSTQQPSIVGDGRRSHTPRPASTSSVLSYASEV